MPEVEVMTAAIIMGFVSVVGAFLYTVRYMVKNFLTQLKPNHGTSLADKINKLEKRIDDIYIILSKKMDNK